MTTMELHILNRLVLGTAGLAGIWGRVDRRESIRVIHAALDMGINHFDTAPAYAEAEQLLSDALSSWKGHPVFISTKAGKKKADSPDATLFDYAPLSIERSVDESRKLFQRDVLDLVFLHDPVCMKKEEMKGAIDAMLEMKHRGWIRHLGIGGNYGPEFESYALSGYFNYFMGYNRYNLIKQVANKGEFVKVKQAGVSIWQASPLYMGLLGSKHDLYLREKPEWIPEEDLQAASAMKQWCEEKGIRLSGLAHNFIMMSDCIDKMVIGASSMIEFETTMNDLHSDALRQSALRWLGE